MGIEGIGGFRRIWKRFSDQLFAPEFFKTCKKGKKKTSQIQMAINSDISLNHQKRIEHITFFRYALAIPSVPLSDRQAVSYCLESAGVFLKNFLNFSSPKPSKIPNSIIIDTGKFGKYTLYQQILPPIPPDISQDQFLNEISMKIQNGGLLYEKILNGFISSEPPQLEHISNLLWFLQVKAEQKVGPFIFGSISLEDKELRLLTYFDNCNEIYQRTSSHLNEFQSYQGKFSGVHRSIDFTFEPYDSSQGISSYLSKVLPYGKTSLLIMPMLEDSGLIKENRLLLKMEIYGAYQYKLKNKDRSSGPKSREENSDDSVLIVGRAWGIVRSLIQIKTCDERRFSIKKESIPIFIVSSFKKFINEFNKRKLTEFYTTLKWNNPISTSGGIRIMARNIESLMVLASCPTLQKIGIPELPYDIVKPINDFYNIITDPRKFDHTDVRIGNEVIFDSKELID